MDWPRGKRMAERAPSTTAWWQLCSGIDGDDFCDVNDVTDDGDDYCDVDDIEEDHGQWWGW